jgi:type VI secretion system protein ImpK
VADHQTPTKRDSLSSACSRAFSVILALGGGQDLGAVQSVRARLSSTLGSIEAAGPGDGYTAEDLRTARYALTAFADETIARTSWPGRAEWMQNPLSLTEFNDNNAGDGFFAQLATIRRQAEAKPELLEVYYTCLALGFEGKYALADPRERLALIKEIGRDLEHLRPGAAELSPRWQPPEKLNEMVGGGLPLGVITAIAAGLVCIAFIALNFLLNGEANRLISQF